MTETIEPDELNPTESAGAGPRAPRRSRALAAVLLAVVVIAGASVAWAVSGIVKEHRAGGEVVEPGLSAAERDSLGLDSDVRLLWDQPAGVAVARAMTVLPGVQMTELYELDFYSNYAFATGVDPADSGIALHAEWRRGVVTSARVRLGGSARGDAALPTFVLGDVPWSRLGDLMDEAVRRLGVQDPDVRYLQIDAGLYGGTGLTLRIYVSGPRASGGLVEADASGTIVRVIPDGLPEQRAQ